VNLPFAHQPAAVAGPRSLASLAVGEQAVIAAIDPAGTSPDAALRLLEMGFCEGALVAIAHVAPLGADSLVAHVGPTMVALRRAMADLVQVAPQAAGG
jgi:Fe2+ transport system protein FeoA